MKLFLISAAFCLILQDAVAPPVTANKKEDAENHEGEAEHKGADWDIGLEYNRYLQEVVQALESDPQFREKLEKAEVADIRTGKIASELEFVNHNVRSKLDELKRQELERLRHLAIKQYELTKQQEEEQQQQQEHNGDDQGYGYDHHANNEINDPARLRIPHHIDHKNPHSFEIDDLRKLIVQTTKDLEEADRKRREEFKEYEMQKEYEKQQQLNLLDEEHKKEMEEKIHEQEEKHKNHPSLHHPGSKHQLEQVWEEQDHMNPEDFNPKTFFHLHDLDGNGFWDADEVKTLFQKELDKMYDPNAPEDDMRERREEMERMREHVFNETDVNRDQMISYQEFLDQTKKQEFDQDPGWDGLDNQKLYTQEEYEEFERRRQAEVQRMIEQGMLPPQPEQMHLPYGLQVPPEYMQHQPQHHGSQPLPPHAMPQHPPQYQPGQGHPQGQPQQYQYHPDPNYAGHHQAPVHPGQQQQQQYHPQQGAPVYQQQGHPPQGQGHPMQGHPNQVPQGQPIHHNQPPPPHQNQPPAYQHNQPPIHQNQPPVYQNQAPVHQNQPPVHQNQPPVHQNQPPVHQNQPPVHQNPPPVHQNQPPVQQQNQLHDNQLPVHQSQQPPVHANSQQNIPPSPHQAQQQHPNAVPNNAPPPPPNAIHQDPVKQAHSNEIPKQVPQH